MLARPIRHLILLAMSCIASLPAQADSLMLCFGYGCRHSQSVQLGRAERQALAELFRPGRTAAQERAAIAQAVALFERIAGRQTPVHRDRGGNPIQAQRPGQLDCIDESLNTTALLILLEQKGLLRWHRVLTRAYRAPLILDQHWAAQVEQLDTGARYVVDSWPQDNGQPALVQALEAWRWRQRPAP